VDPAIQGMIFGILAMIFMIIMHVLRWFVVVSLYFFCAETFLFVLRAGLGGRFSKHNTYILGPLLFRIKASCLATQSKFETYLSRRSCNNIKLFALQVQCI
jgi:hypothetical protein